MDEIKIPAGYHSDLSLHDTQVAIKTVKDFFQQTLAQKLNLSGKQLLCLYFPESQEQL